VVDTLRRIANSSAFQNFITLVILLAGVVVGVETYPDLVTTHHTALDIADKVILWIFVAEVVIKIGAEGSRPWRYFADPWNVFDFAIVAVCFMPVDAQFVTVLRLARVLRVLKLVRALPELQVLVGALLKSIPSMGYVTLLLMLLFYLYAVTATFIFGANDPVHFGNLQISMLSLFRVVTLEGWTELLYIQMYGCADYGYDGMEAMCTASKPMPLFASAYFISFILIGTMVILNLFVGVIMSGMADAQKEAEDEQRRAARGHGEPDIQDELHEMHQQLNDIQEQLGRIRRLAEAGRRTAR
jgi:voltage-gated sodium channel